MKITILNLRSFKSSNRALSFWLLAVLCLLVLGGLSGCDEKAKGHQVKRPPVEVGVVTVHKEAVNLTAELPGRTTASVKADVRPQVDGIILERLFREGSEVEAGDVLYKIDPSTYQALYDSSVAALHEAQAALPSAESKAKRDAKLILHKAISSQDYEDAKAIFEGRKAAVALAKANVQKAKINLDYTSIKAPISGRIAKSSLTKGALVTANQATPLTTIRCLDPINVDLTQSSTSFLNLRQEIAAGQISISGSTIRVKLKLENGSLYPLEGVLKFSEANVDEDTGTYIMRAEFPNPDRLLLPGMYVRALITEGVISNGYLVPQLAVTRNTKGEAVARFVNKDGKIEQRVISVRKSIGHSWLVDSGVHEGDKIVVKGLQFVSSGQTVLTKEMEVVDATGKIIPKNSAERDDSSIQSTGNATVKKG